MVWIPKCCRRSLYGELHKYLGQVFKELARARQCEVIEGHLGLRAHTHINSAQVFSGADSRVYQ
ncbi:MAG: hypothetical protein HKP58_03845 [Desulfatitalea sp.]|nr:hypothetical protein [Desulfatitalea sp.]NNJ99525.1 hypothetical protein [Desulfatitalea sp.]